MAKKKTPTVQAAGESDLEPIKESEFTPRQQRFIREYAACGIGCEAAERAGYSYKSSRQQASFLLTNPNILVAIQAEKEKLQKKYEFSTDRWIQENVKAAFADIGDVLDWERGRLKVRDKEDMPPVARQAIEAMTETVTEYGGTLSVKMRDKNKALELLGKHFGLLDGTGTKKPTSDLKDRVLKRLRNISAGRGGGSDQGSV